jgi:eukaryotic-like serine/threonine-protein kinase
MNVLERFRLPLDVIMFPAKALADDVRRNIDCSDEDYVVTRPRSRTPSKVVDAGFAELLAQFKEPKQIIDAVVEFSTAAGHDPDAVLEERFPALCDLIESGFLVVADSQFAEVITASLNLGDQVHQATIREIVQVLEDTELYRAEAPDGANVAIKIARPGCERRVAGFLRREGSVLKHLDGLVNPQLVARGDLNGRPYLVLAWCQGERVTSVAARLRRSRGLQAIDLINLAARILEAYSHLHSQSVVHGDIHPGNLLVMPDHSVTILDFGFAVIHGRKGIRAPPRGGIARYFEPEYVSAYLRREDIPTASFAGDQYALAVLLYELISGADYLDFSHEKRTMFEQIANEAPRSFSDRGVAPWWAVEATIAKALSKEPADRFSSVAEFAATLRAAGANVRSGFPALRAAQDTQVSKIVSELAKSAHELLSSPQSDSSLRAPTCSINYGLAGLAYTMYRMACSRDDPGLLSGADACAEKAILLSNRTNAFHNADIGITAEVVGSVSVYHTLSGLFAVRALVSHAMGDFATQNAALRGFVSHSSYPCDNLDITLGRSSTLLACSLLLRSAPVNNLVNTAPLVALATATLTDLWTSLDRMPAIAECAELPQLGMAHGWAGFLYATLRWCQAAQVKIPERLRQRLEELAACRTTAGRGLRWRRKIALGASRTRADYMPGWCNGSAGFVHLWTLAHEMLSDDMFAKLAEGSATNAWDSEETSPNLCCGTTGRSYALLNMYRSSGDVKWLHRARKLSRLSTAGAARVLNGQHSPRYSLYKGRLGVEALVVDLTEPDAASMPFFEAEGW